MEGIYRLFINEKLIVVVKFVIDRYGMVIVNLSVKIKNVLFGGVFFKILKEY